MKQIWVFLASLMLAGAVSALAQQDAPERILALVADGQDAEAVALYESAVDPDTASLDVLRAVAGSYWRLRRFEVARGLYRRIIQHEPALAGLVGSESPPPSVASSTSAPAESPVVALPAAEEPPVSAQDETDIPEEAVALVPEQTPAPDSRASERASAPEQAPEPVVQDAAESATPVAALPEKGMPAPEQEMVTVEDAPPASSAESADVTIASTDNSDLQVELRGLRDAYSQLEAERARQRQMVEDRIIDLMARAESTVQQIGNLERDLARTRADRETEQAAAAARESALLEERSTLDENVQRLERDLSAARGAYADLESQILEGVRL